MQGCGWYGSPHPGVGAEMALGAARLLPSKPPTPDGLQWQALQLGERGESRQPRAGPNHRYVMRRFLLWRHFCGIGGPACSPSTSCLLTCTASLSGLSTGLWP